MAIVDQVSIPAGFSNALRRPCRIRDRPIVEFQSLLGFLMRCDVTVVRPKYPTMPFQSLLGFLMRCDGKDPRTGNTGVDVSIPAGFSNALRQQEIHRVAPLF